MADKVHILTDQKLEQMEKHLSAVYSEALDGIQKKADEYFSKFEELDEKKRALLAKGKITEKEYKQWRKNKILYSKRFTELKEELSKQLLNVNQTALAYINGELPEVYALNYNALAGDLKEIKGYSFTLTDADTVKNLAQADKSLLPYKEIDPTKDIPWNMQKINSEVLQGVMLGDSIPDIAKRIKHVEEMNKVAAIRSARTIVTGAENKGRQDSYARAAADGIIMEKEWLAAIDSRTRHVHALLNGQRTKVEKPFHSELGDIMFPGDPSAHPSNVYNCRCTMVPKVMGFSKVENNTKGLTTITEDAIILSNDGMNRSKQNQGAFSIFPERMTRKHIRQVAKEAGIDLKGLTLNIEQDTEWIRSPYTGRADSEQIGGITFFPNAFRSKEELIRTIYHEKIHVEQFKKHGTVYVQNNRQRFETEAYEKEEAFINALKQKGVL